MASVNDNTGMQTHIRVDADGSALPVGYELDPFDLRTDKIVGNGYSIVNTPEPGKPVRLLDIWTCPTCQTEQWAMITIDQNRIQLVEAVKLDRASLNAVNFISDVNAEIVSERFDPSGGSVIDTLRRHLP